MKCASRRLQLLRLALAIALVWHLFGVLGGPARAGVIESSDAEASGGFWEAKPKLIQAMREDRRIVVSSKVERKGSREQPLDHFQIQGAGWVKAKADVAFRAAQDYERLPELSEHFRKVIWTAERRELFLSMAALGYVAEMKLAMRARELKAERELAFEVIEGHFLGLKGRLLFTPKPASARGSGEATQVALFVDHVSPELPLPRALMGIVLEAIAEKVAQRMRRHIESVAQASPVPSQVR
ncbi:MAG TPA: SRPBCC family protein [Pseudobdellovibrionaceae bacterium]|nr:SRPBCC family protein [Pseudobdellovibrionaceae bacterium]